jgi:hypothetical protein
MIIFTQKKKDTEKGCASYKFNKIICWASNNFFAYFLEGTEKYKNLFCL